MNCLVPSSARLRTSVLPRWLTGLFVLASVPAVQAQHIPVVRPQAGMVITRSVKLRPGTYRLEAPDDSTPVITIRGRGIDVDLTGVMLLGTSSIFSAIARD